MTEPAPARPQRPAAGHAGLSWWLTLVLGWLLCSGATALAAQPAPAADANGVTRHPQAALLQTEYRPAEGDPVAVASLSVLPPPGAGAPWTPVDLPMVMPRSVQAGADGPLQVWWYLLRQPAVAPAAPAPPLALYVPRVSGGAVLVARHLGGQWRLIWDGREQWREQWNRPLWVDLAEQPTAEGPLTLAIGIVHWPGSGHRLTAPRIGPREALSGALAWRHLLQQVAPQVSSLSFASLGLFALLFWLGRRGEPAYLWFALSSVVWTLRNLHYYMDLPQDEGQLVWFWWATNVSLSWVMVLVYLFAFRFDSRRYPWLERSLMLFVGAMTVLTLPAANLLQSNLLAQHLVNTAVAVAVTSWMTVVAWRGGGREFRLITAALWVSELFGLHDLLLVAGRITPESVYLLPFATLLLFLAFLYAVQRRYAQAIAQVERTNQSLEQRLAEREAQLQANHERMRAIERDQALLLERQRLVRDMHDGLGSTLMSSLVLVEQGQLDSAAVAELLRECVDDLRLVIDSLEPIGQDLVMLMASLRHRLGRRLEAAGLTLAWEVEDLPPLPWLNPPDALQVLRIVQEVLTNVLKHAQARHIRIATRVTPTGVQVAVEDDGVGFDLAAPRHGRGLRHLSQRAARLGGQLRIDSAPGTGTRVWLDLPLQRSGPA